MSSRPLKLVALVLAALVSAVALPPAAKAAPDPAGCTTGVQYDPTVPQWDDVFAAGDPDGAIVPFTAGGPGRSTGKNPTVALDRYFDAVQAAVASSPRVAMKKITVGQSEIGALVGNDAQGRPFRRIDYWVVSTPQNIASFETDGKFWADVRDGNVSEADGLAAVRTKPAIGWVTATPHGNEPAAGEAIARQLYELTARLDCANARRLQNMDVILDPVRNPDGRDNNVRTTSWGFDPNRDFGVRNYKENAIFLPEIAKYPGVFYIDAHQQSSGYFFPPNEDPVHHEISDFSLDFIQNQIGPKLQQVFNDQSGAYQNYAAYDLFTPEYGDTVPSLLMGAAGMTYEKGTDESYGKQVYDHYLAIDTTINLTSDNKVKILTDWVKQWQEAIEQGQRCELQPNKLVSPLHEEINQQPNVSVCGYFYRPDAHEGDVARLMKALREVGVKVFRIDADTPVGGLHAYGRADVDGTLPKGTLYIPMAQAQKHWIQSILGEDPFIPYNYYYDVVTWSYGMNRGLAGDGFLTQQLPAGTPLSPVDTVALGAVPAAAPAVYAFDTDSAEALGLVVDLLDRGVNVYRGTTAFTEDGVAFESGAAMFDAAALSTAGVTVAQLTELAGKRNTPISGLDRFPVEHQQVVKPKIGLYVDAVPQNPLSLTSSDLAALRANPRTAPNTGHCTARTDWCAARFVLTQKDRIPSSQIVPITTAQVAAGQLVSGGFTALINPAQPLTGAAADAVAAFVNTGKTYVGTDNEGAAGALEAGLTSIETTTIPDLLTPGSTFDARFDLSSPVAWGFDEGGWIWRNESENPVFDPATLGDGKAVVSYAPAPMRSYGYSNNALGAGQLGGRPAVVEDTLGEGHSVLIGWDPFFRGWKDHDERLVLNAALYPTGAPLPASAVSRASAAPAATEATAPDPVGTPLKPSALPQGKRAAKPRRKISRDVLITVARKDARKLRAAVKAAKLRKGLRRRVHYRVTRRTIRLEVRGARRGVEHDRTVWTSRIMGGLERRGVRIRLAQL